MQRLQAFKFELMPNGQQMRKMSQFAGMCRFVFNQALALQKENHEAGNKFLNYAALTKHLTVWRNSPETAWLSQGPSQAQQQTLKDLEKAYKNFFEKRASFPKFKRKGDNCSFRFPDPKQFKLDEPYFLAKIRLDSIQKIAQYPGRAAQYHRIASRWQMVFQCANAA